jgi:hypothetical protein
METNENSKNQNQKFIIALIALALSFGIYVFFNPPGGSQSPTIVKNDTVFIPKLDSNEVKDSTLVCINCDKETIGQPMDHFRRVLQNYRTQIWDSINQNTIFNTATKGLPYASLEPQYSKTDARCIWFSLNTLKQFICTVEKNSANLTIPSSDLGVRFYYAVYENDYEDENKRNRHTLFMVPTCKSEKGAAMDFDPRETYARRINPEFKGRYKDKILSFSDLLNEGGTKNILTLGENESSSPDPEAKMVKNNGELCPDNCPTVNTLSVIDKP